MPSPLVTESITAELGAQEPWPQDVKLFQPFEVEQILLPDNANCLAVQAFLKMCNIKFEVEQRRNAEYMSPAVGRVPFIKCGAFLIAEMDPIVAFFNTKNVSISKHLNQTQKADMRAYMSLINNVLTNAEMYLCWCDNVTLAEVTKPRNGSVHPWPLNLYINYNKRNQILKRLNSLGWKSKTLDEVHQEVESCCYSLSERLGEGPYFFGSRPTELDALLFGHLFSILTTPLPNNKFSSIVRGYSNLVELCQFVERDFFDRFAQ